MAAIYYENIDVQGHHWGPDSQQVRTAVQQLDGAMQTLNSKIKVSLSMGFFSFDDHYSYTYLVKELITNWFLSGYFCRR